MNTLRTALMLKAPRAGMVKTRLAASIGATAACAAYQCLVEHLLHGLANSQEISVHFAPAAERAFMDAWLRPFSTSLSFTAQSEGDLGDRLVAAARHEFAHHASRLALIGGDCPYLGKAQLDASFTALQSHDLVLGPSRDGGYYLIAFKRVHPELFNAIDWSTERVLAQTLERAAGLGLSCFQLETLEDVDTAEDWERACDTLGLKP